MFFQFNHILEQLCYNLAKKVRLKTWRNIVFSTNATGRQRAKNQPNQCMMICLSYAMKSIKRKKLLVLKCGDLVISVSPNSHQINFFGLVFWDCCYGSVLEKGLHVSFINICMTGLTSFIVSCFVFLFFIFSTYTIFWKKTNSYQSHWVFWNNSQVSDLFLPHVLGK